MFDEIMDFLDLYSVISEAVDLASNATNGTDMWASHNSTNATAMLDEISGALDHADLMTAIDEAIDHVEFISAIDEAIDFANSPKQSSTYLYVAGGLILALGAAALGIKKQAFKNDDHYESLLN